jgi:membrane protease YdiL (CAAX protease family)
MITTIGTPFKSSPRLLWSVTVAAALLVGADLATVAFGMHLRLDSDFRFALAILGCLCCAFVSAATPEKGGMAFGFRLAPLQGWMFWVIVAATVGAVLFVALVAAAIVFAALGSNLPEPGLIHSSQIWPLFIGMCVVWPLFEEVIYRLVFCPPCAALLGARTCIVLNGLVFAGLHFLYGNAHLENLVGGFILSWAFLKSGTLIIPIALHAGGNFFAFLLNVGYFWWLGSLPK